MERERGGGREGGRKGERAREKRDRELPVSAGSGRKQKARPLMGTRWRCECEEVAESIRHATPTHGTSLRWKLSGLHAILPAGDNESPHVTLTSHLCP